MIDLGTPAPGPTNWRVWVRLAPERAVIVFCQNAYEARQRGAIMLSQNSPQRVDPGDVEVELA